MYKRITNPNAKCQRYKMSKFIHKKFPISDLMTQLRDNGPFSIPIELEILYKIDL